MNARLQRWQRRLQQRFRLASQDRLRPWWIAFPSTALDHNLSRIAARAVWEM